MLGTVGFADGGCTQCHVLHSNLDFVIQYVELDDASILILDGFIGSDSNVANNSFKPTILGIGRWDAIIV